MGQKIRHSKIRFLLSVMIISRLPARSPLPALLHRSSLRCGPMSSLRYKRPPATGKWESVKGLHLRFQKRSRTLQKFM